MKLDLNIHQNVRYWGRSMLLSSACMGMLMVLSPVTTYAEQQEVILQEEAEVITVTGVVVDAAEMPLPGVSVTLKGAPRGEITDLDGRFTFKDVPSDGTLVFSFIGMKTVEMPISGQKHFNVVMQEDAYALEEVVAVGYGSQKKSDLTGSVSSISTRDLNQAAVPQLETAMQGRIAGVEVMKGDNAPGAGMEIRIRGAGSINASSSPLYVIDGFPVESSFDSGDLGSSGGQSPLSGLSPSDIASIDILKDASATAIYGARGANGVVIITTKSGNEDGKLDVEYNGRAGVQQMIRKYEMMDAQEYAYFVHANTFHKQYYHEVDPSKQSEYWDYEGNFGDTPTTNWIDEITQLGRVSDHNVSITGGNKKSNYAISGGYYSNEGIVKETGFDRYTANLKYNATPSKYVKLGLNTRLAYSENEGTVTMNSGAASSNTGMIAQALMMRPTISPYDDNGNLTFQEFDEDGIMIPANPLINIMESEMLRQNFSNFTNAYVEISPIKSLKFRSQAGLTYLQNKNSRFVSSRTSWGRQKNGEASIVNDNRLKYLSESTLNWKQNFKRHNFNLLGGFSFQGDNRSMSRMSATNFPIETLGYNDIGAGASYAAPLSYAEESYLVSYLGRLNYSYASKYLLTASYRADGSSKFSKNNKWGYFPSLALAWRLSEEDFLKDVDWLAGLKLRAGWGQTGNPNIPAYQSLSTYSMIMYPNRAGSTEIGVVPNNPANDNLKWETSEQTNIGLDMSLFNSRVTFAADAYYKRTRDLLLRGEIPSSSGYTQFLYNSGQVDNRGVELALNTVNVDGAFKWFTDINVTFNRNEVVDLGSMNTSGEMLVPTSDSNTNAEAILIEGRSIGMWYGYQTNGIWKQEDFTWNGAKYELKPIAQDANGNNVYPASKGSSPIPGQRRFKDISGPEGIPDGVVNDYDKTVIGNSMPLASGGINNRFEYKGIDLAIFLDWSFGRDVYNMNRLMMVEGSIFNNKMKGDYYMPAQYDELAGDGSLYVENGKAITGNPDGTLPLFGDSFHTTHDAYMEDGSYIRLANVSLGYKLPAHVVQKMKMQHFRIYATANNLYTWTNYSGYDPSVNAASMGGLRPGLDRSSYPLARAFNLGVQLKF